MTERPRARFRERRGDDRGRLTRASPDLVLVCASALWALNYSVVRVGVGQLQPLAFPVFRFGAAGLVLLLVVWLREGSVGLDPADRARVVLAGLFGVTLSQAFLVYSLSNTSASDFALLMSATPLVTTLLATLVGLERLGRLHWLTVALGLVGVVLIVVGATGFSIASTGFLGDVLAVGTVLVSSASAVVMQPLVRRYSVVRVVANQMLIGTALLLPIAAPALITQDYAAVSATGWAALGYSALFAGIATSLLYFTAIRQIGPSRSAMYQYLESMLGVAFAVVLLAEAVTSAQVVGGLVVVASVTFGRFRGARQSRPGSHSGRSTR